MGRLEVHGIYIAAKYFTIAAEKETKHIVISCIRNDPQSVRFIVSSSSRIYLEIYRRT
jgi:hypothetical protein